MRIPRRVTWLGLATAACLLAVGCEEPPQPKKEVVRPVKIHVIGSLQPEAMLEYPGTIQAVLTAEMGFEVPGRVLELPVKEGDHVKKGQLLARIDPRDYEAELKVALANLEKAQADLKRSENIFKEDPGAISQDDLERDRRAVKVAEAEAEIKRKALADTELRALFDGVVARILVPDFANVQAKQPVLILQDTSTLEIEVAVPERDFAKGSRQELSKEELTKRLAPKVIVTSLKDREFDARITEYALVADPVTRTFPVTLQFDNPEDVTILPGMTARVRIVIDPDSAYSVPSTAVRGDADKKPYVWKVNPETMQVERQLVETGPLSGDRVLLRSGVEKGDWVAISGVTQLRPGMKVRKYERHADKER